MNSTIITTAPHHISAHRYMVTVAESWLGRHWWTLALPVAACLAIGATVNVAFTFVAFVLLCLVLPFIMMMLYFNYALTPEAAMAVRPHTVRIHPTDGIDVEFMPNPDNGRTYAPVHISWLEVQAAEKRSSDVAITFRNRCYRYLIIPYFSLNDDTDRVNAMLATIDRAIAVNQIPSPL